MSLERGNPNRTPETQAGTTAPSQEQSSAGLGGGQSSGNEKLFSLSRMASFTALPFSRRPGSEAGIELARKIDELVEKHKAETRINTYVLDQNAYPDLKYAIVLVAVSDPADNKSPVAYHALLLEGSTEDKLHPITENVAGYGSIEVRFVPGDTIDEDLVKAMTQYISGQFPGRPILYASSEVVPASFDLSDNSAVHRLLGNAATAAGTQLVVRRPDFVDFDLTKTKMDAQLSLRVTSSDDHGRDAVGLPFRSDILIDLSLSPLNRNVDSQNVLRRSLDLQQQLTSLSGYVDLAYTPSDSVGQSGGQFFGVNKPSQTFRPRFVITNFESVNSVSLSLQLLTLLTATKLAENHAWAGAFQTMARPKAKGQINFRDIGAIGFDLDTLPGGLPGNREIDTSPENFSPQVLRLLLSHAVFPDLVFTIDIDEAGPQTWINAVFAAVGNGNPQATAALVKAANSLTGGHFQKYWDQSKPLVVAENNRIHAGTWRDSQDRLRSIDEFDYLAALNYYGRKGEMDSVRVFSESHFDTNIPLSVRLDKRWNLIVNAMGGSVRHTGFKRRYNLTSNLLTPLVMGARDAGLVTTSNINLGEISSIQRAHLDMSQFTLGGQATGLFSGGFGTGNPNLVFNPLAGGQQSSLGW